MAVSPDPTRDEGPAPATPAYAWRSLSIGLAAMIVSSLLGIGFFVVGGIFAILSDLAALATGLALLPLAWALHDLHGSEARAESAIVRALGLAALVLVVLGSLGLVVRPSPDVLPVPWLGLQFAGYGGLGLWLLGLGHLALRTGRFPARVGWAAVVTGIGYVASMGGIVTVGFQHPLVGVAFVLSIGGFIVWALWLGRELRSSR